MANDRVYLRCKGCKKTVLFFKFWGGGETGPLLQVGAKEPFDSEKEAETRIGETEVWIDEHLRDCRGAFGMNLGDDPGLELVTEGQL